MGVIYKGRDRDLGRDVALKVLRRMHGQNPEVFRRFVEEAQIGGQLQHPGIVPVYSLGLQPDGRPCFAMKLIKGRTLAATLNERRTPADRRRSMLRAFERVCQTVAYAHARGVIHRDLKPSNIMLGAFGEVLVVDWGFGKVLGRREEPEDGVEKTLVTTVRTDQEGSASIAGSVMGTPAYMPPEQALGHVEELDEQTDVFALGAILTEILTGKPPYVGDSKDLLVMAAQARLGDAIERIDACDADPELKALAKRCLAPLRAHRPANAKEVAEVVGRVLSQAEDRAHEAELDAVRERARSAQATSHAAAERRAKRLTISLAAAVLIAVVGGGLFHIRRVQGDHARQTAALPAFEEAIEEVSLLQGQARWDEALVAAKKAQHLAADLDERAKQRAAGLVADTARAQSDAEAEATQAAKDEALLAALEEARIQRFDPYVRREATDAAYAEAFRVYGLPPEEFGKESTAAFLRSRDDAFAARVAAALDDWSSLRLSITRPSGSDWQTLMALAQACDPDVTQRRLRTLFDRGDAEGLRKLASDEDAQLLPPRSLMQLGSALWGVGLLDEGIAFLEKATQRHPSDLWLHYVLGGAHYEQGHFDEARTHYTTVLALRPDSVGAHNMLGGLLCDRLSEFEAALRIFDEAARLAPQDPAVHFNRGNALQRLRRLEEALRAYEQALDLDPSYATVYCNYGNALAAVGRTSEAIAFAERGLALDASNVESRNSYGVALMRARRLEEGVAELRQALELAPQNADVLNNLGNALLTIGRVHEALPYHRRAIELDPGNPVFCRNRPLIALGEHQQAYEACLGALELNTRDPDAYQVYTNLGNALVHLRRFDEAIDAYREAVALRPDHPDTHMGLGVALAAASHDARALASFDKALELDSSHSNTRSHRAILLHKMGRDKEALAEYWRVDREDPTSYQALGNLLPLKPAPALEAAEACVL